MSYSCDYNSSIWEDRKHKWVSLSIDLDENDADTAVMVLNRLKELVKSMARDMIIAGDDDGTAESISLLRFADSLKRAVIKYLDELEAEEMEKKEVEEDD